METRSPADILAAFQRSDGDLFVAQRCILALYMQQGQDGFAAALGAAIRAWPHPARDRWLTWLTLALIKFDKPFPRLWLALISPGIAADPDDAASCLVAVLRACEMSAGRLPSGAQPSDITSAMLALASPGRLRILLPKWCELVLLLPNGLDETARTATLALTRQLAPIEQSIASLWVYRYRFDVPRGDKASANALRLITSYKKFPLLARSGDLDVLKSLVEALTTRDVASSRGVVEIHILLSRLTSTEAAGPLLIEMFQGPVAGCLYTWLTESRPPACDFGHLQSCLNFEGFVYAFMDYGLRHRKGRTSMFEAIRTAHAGLHHFQPVHDVWAQVARAWHDAELADVHEWWRLVKLQVGTGDLVQLYQVLYWLVRRQRAAAFHGFVPRHTPLSRALVPILDGLCGAGDLTLQAWFAASMPDESPKISDARLAARILVLVSPPEVPDLVPVVAEKVCRVLFVELDAQRRARVLAAIEYALAGASPLKVHPMVWRFILDTPGCLMEVLGYPALLRRLRELGDPKQLSSSEPNLCVLACDIARERERDVYPSREQFLHAVGPHHGPMLTVCIELAYPGGGPPAPGGEQVLAWLRALLDNPRRKTLARWITAALTERGVLGDLLLHATQQLVSQGRFDFDAIPAAQVLRQQLRHVLGDALANTLFGGLHTLARAAPLARPRSKTPAFDAMLDGWIADWKEGLGLLQIEHPGAFGQWLDSDPHQRVQPLAAQQGCVVFAESLREDIENLLVRLQHAHAGEHQAAIEALLARHQRLVNWMNLPGSAAMLKRSGTFTLHLLDKASPLCVLLGSDLAKSYSRRRRFAAVIDLLVGPYLPCVAIDDKGVMIAATWWAPCRIGGKSLALVELHIDFPGKYCRAVALGGDPPQQDRIMQVINEAMVELMHAAAPQLGVTQLILNDAVVMAHLPSRRVDQLHIEALHMSLVRKEAGFFADEVRSLRIIDIEPAAPAEH